MIYLWGAVVAVWRVRRRLLDAISVAQTKCSGFVPPFVFTLPADKKVKD
jgi:hypothetical protein